MNNESKIYLMPEKNKLAQYVDTTGELSSGQLKLSSWYLRHKILLQQIGTGILTGFCVAVGGFSLFSWGKYLIVDYWQDQKTLVGQTQQFQNYTLLQNIYKAKEIEVTETRVFNSSQDMYDFFAIAVNPNERWIAHIDYHFTYPNGETKMYRSTLLPGSKRPLAVFGQESESYPSQVQFVLDHVTWESINPHKISDVGLYMKERLIFNFDDFVFSPPSKTGIDFPAISLNVYNDSAYSFWDAVFYVELLNNNQTVGYIYFSVPNFKSLEKRVIDLRYFGDNLTVTDIKIIPVVNIFDRNIFINPQGEAKK